jgi:hypothetical protein
MAKKKVFVSFDYDNDKRYKTLLKAWDANPNFDTSFPSSSLGMHTSLRGVTSQITGAFLRPSEFALLCTFYLFRIP